MAHSKKSLKKIFLTISCLIFHSYQLCSDRFTNSASRSSSSAASAGAATTASTTPKPLLRMSADALNTKHGLDKETNDNVAKIARSVELLADALSKGNPDNIPKLSEAMQAVAKAFSSGDPNNFPAFTKVLGEVADAYQKGKFDAKIDKETLDAFTMITRQYSPERVTAGCVTCCAAGSIAWFGCGLFSCGLFLGGVEYLNPGTAKSMYQQGKKLFKPTDPQVKRD